MSFFYENINEKMQKNHGNCELSEFYDKIGSNPSEDYKNDAHTTSSSTSFNSSTTTTANFTTTTNIIPAAITTTNRSREEEESGRKDSTSSKEAVDEDYSSDDSSFSQISGLSEESGKDWKPKNKSLNFWLQQQMHSGVDPRQLLSQILPSGTTLLAQDLNDMTLWRILASILQEPPRRQKLSHVNTLEDVSFFGGSFFILLVTFIQICGKICEWWKKNVSQFKFNEWKDYKR